MANSKPRLRFTLGGGCGEDVLLYISQTQNFAITSQAPPTLSLKNHFTLITFRRIFIILSTEAPPDTKRPDRGSVATEQVHQVQATHISNNTKSSDLALLSYSNITHRGNLTQHLRNIGIKTTFSYIPS